VSDNSNLGTTEDIPVALRDARKAKPDPPVPTRKLSVFSIAMGAVIVLFGGAALNFTSNQSRQNSDRVDRAAVPQLNNNFESRNQTTDPNPDTVLGHFRYAEAPASELVAIGGGFRLRKTAAKKYQAMIAAARSAGIKITTISTFRSVAEQDRLFFGVGAARAQQPSKRAEVSAPPKHSEHHTGYAVDLGDATVPATNLNQNFETTPAYKWLKANAARYSFELSFPQNNPQGVSYEPWHWRYVGDSDSLETFYRARKLK
jgi:D-alanyl-D-alanine carboxypeptidase